MTVHLSVWIWPAAFAVWVLGIAFGVWVGLGLGFDRGYAEAEEDEAAERTVRDDHVSRRQNKDPKRRTSTAAFLAPEVAHEAFLAHADQAMALTRPPGQLAEAFDVDAEIARMHADMDGFLATVVDRYRSPYPDLGGGQQ